MDLLKKILRNFEGYVCVVMLLVMSVVVFIQVVFRFVLKASLPWSEELSRYLLVWVSFLGGAYGIKTGAHLGIEAVKLMLPKKAQQIVQVVAILLGIVICAIILKLGVDLVSTQLRRIQYSPAMRIPMAYAYAAVPVGMVFFIIRYIVQLVEVLGSFRKKVTE
ncbi:MAG: TRAP transporter small permease [Eubacteriales bacterium]|nr:TRAP transporter small permease [Eubacteriales bacterium]